MTEINFILLVGFPLAAFILGVCIGVWMMYMRYELKSVGEA